MPLKQIQDECPAELRAQIFSHQVTDWFRQGDFQLATLKKIASEMLAPMRHGIAPDVYVAGEIELKQMNFRKRVLLYASVHNPGAEEVAREFAVPYKGIEIADKHSGNLGFGQGNKSAQERSGRRRMSIRKMRSTPTFGARLGESLANAHESLANAHAKVHANLHADAKPKRQHKLAAELTPEEAAVIIQRIYKNRRFQRLTARMRQPTHFLLYLNNQTFVGEDGAALAAQVRQARSAGLTMIMFHEQQAEKGACSFDRFFSITPEDLIEQGHVSNLPSLYFPHIRRMQHFSSHASHFALFSPHVASPLLSPYVAPHFSPSVSPDSSLSICQAGLYTKTLAIALFAEEAQRVVSFQLGARSLGANESTITPQMVLEESTIRRSRTNRLSKGAADGSREDSQVSVEIVPADNVE